MHEGLKEENSDPGKEKRRKTPGIRTGVRSEKTKMKEKQEQISKNSSFSQNEIKKFEKKSVKNE